MRKQMIFLLVLTLVLQMGVFGIGAAEPADLQAGGTITVRMKTVESAANTGSLTFYHVAHLTEKNGSFRYELTEEFAPTEANLQDPNSPDLAQDLAEFAEKNRISGRTERIRDGKVDFEVPEGRLGLYLIVQREACEGYEKINPFVIGVPQLRDGIWCYRVDATPKMGPLIPKPTEPTCPGKPTEPDRPTCPGKPTEPDRPTCPGKPTEPDRPTCPGKPTEPERPTCPGKPTEPDRPTCPGKPTEPERPTCPGKPTEPEQPTAPTNPEKPTEPSESRAPQEPPESTQPELPTEPSQSVPSTPPPQPPTEPGLPQTGQLNWPVPMLALAGVLLFAAGWVLCIRRKKEEPSD